MHEDARAERAILSSAEAYRLVEEARSQRERAERAEAGVKRLTAAGDTLAGMVRYYLENMDSSDAHPDDLAAAVGDWDAATSE